MIKQLKKRSFSFFGSLRIPVWFILTALAMALVVVVSSCSGSSSNQTQDSNQTANKPATIKIDYAYYNPVSLVLKEKGWLEEEFSKDQVKVEWVLSLGSNKALQLLNSRSIDFGSTAGAAALIGKANGNPIKSIYVYSKPEWTALVTTANSSINKVEDLKGKRVAVTQGTDPHVFLLRALDQAGLSVKDIELIPLQHKDGKAALEKGDVDAWGGLDPLMAQTELEKGSRLFFRDANLNTYGVLNVREEFAKEYPSYVERVLAVYEQARKWSVDNPDELKQTLVKESKLTDAVAAKQLERTDLSNSVIGKEQETAINAAGDVLLKSGVIKNSVNVGQVLGDLIDPQFLEKVSKK